MGITLDLPPDIVQYIRRNFGEPEISTALGILRSATLHDGRDPAHRMLRCALAACDNSLKSLEYQVAGLAIDYRDVILSGEYVRKKGDFVQIRDLSQPFESGDA